MPSSCVGDRACGRSRAGQVLTLTVLAAVPLFVSRLNPVIDGVAVVHGKRVVDVTSGRCPMERVV